MIGRDISWTDDNKAAIKSCSHLENVDKRGGLFWSGRHIPAPACHHGLHRGEVVRRAGEADRSVDTEHSVRYNYQDIELNCKLVNLNLSQHVVIVRSHTHSKLMC